LTAANIRGLHTAMTIAIHARTRVDILCEHRNYESRYAPTARDRMVEAATYLNGAKFR
jgi:hypothetical protein